eukprot:1024967-Pelagomonas_calceolata.AAC.2
MVLLLRTPTSTRNGHELVQVQDKDSPLNFQCVEQTHESFSRKITVHIWSEIVQLEQGFSPGFTQTSMCLEEEAHQQASHANSDTHMSLSPSCSASSTGRKAQVMARHRRSTACIRMGKD